MLFASCLLSIIQEVTFSSLATNTVSISPFCHIFLVNLSMVTDPGVTHTVYHRAPPWGPSDCTILMMSLALENKEWTSAWLLSLMSLYKFPSHSSGDTINFLICTVSGWEGASISIILTFSFNFYSFYLSSCNCFSSCSIFKYGINSAAFLSSISLFWSSSF